MEILKTLLIVLEVLVLFNLLIIVHELGHFLAARWRGLVVERFGIWFGKPLWEKEINGVKYSLGCIPAGGFVALPQMAPMEVIEGKSSTPKDQLPQAAPLDRIIVAFAGPLFSFLLALVFAVIVYVIGRPVGETDTTTQIGYVEKNSPAEKGGLLAGDKIIAIDGHPVNRYSGIGDSIKWRIVSSQGKSIDILVERQQDGQTIRTNLQVTPIKDKTAFWERQSMRKIMIYPAQRAVVGELIPHGPGLRAGLQSNDVVVAVNGKTVFSPLGVEDMIQKAGPTPVVLTVKRGTQKLQLTLVPEIPIAPREITNYCSGIEWDFSDAISIDHPRPWEQVRSSLNMMLSTLEALISPKSDVKAHHLSGPVGIMRIYYLLFQSEHGWRMAIWFSVIFSVNLAVLNMLPVPVLDGGHILLALIEGVRRRAFNPKVLYIIQNGFAALIIGFLLFVTFFDVQDLFAGRRHREAPPQKITFAPKPPPKQL